MSDENVTMKFEAEGDLIKFVEELNRRLKEVEAQIPATQKEAAGFDATAKKLGATLGAGAIALKAYQFAMKGVAEACGNMMAAAKVEQVIKATGAAAGLTAKQLNEMSAELASNSIHTGTAVQEAQALLLTFREISGDVFPQAMSAISDMAMMFGGLESSAMQVGKALSDPAEGLAALSRVGVKFTEDQKQLIASMVEAGNVAGAQAVILKQLESQFGGVAKAIADTPAGKLQQLKNEYSDIQATLGEKLIPALVAFQSALNAVTAFMADNVEVAVGLVAGAVVLLIPKIIALSASVAGLTATMMANPLFLAAVGIAVGVMAVAAAVKKLGGDSKDTAKDVEALGDAAVVSVNKLQGLYADVNNFLEQQRQARKSAAQKDADEIAKIYGDQTQKIYAERLALEADYQRKKANYAGMGYKDLGAIDEKYLRDKANLDATLQEVTKDREVEARHRQQKHYAGNVNDHKDMLRQMELDMMGAEARELAILQDTYDKRASLFRDGTKERVLLDTWGADQRSGIIAKYYTERSLAEAEALTESLRAEEAYAKEIEALKEQMADKQKSIVDGIAKHEAGPWEARRMMIREKIAGEMVWFNAGTQERIRLKKMEADLIKEINDQELEDSKRKAEKLKQAAWDDWCEMIKPVEDWGAAAISSLNSVMSVFTALNSAKMKDVDTASRKEIEAINNSRMSSRAKAAEVSRIEQEAAKEKYNLSISQWKQDQAMAIVNAAAAVIKTMATVPFPANIPLAAAQTVAGAAQVAVINANKPKMQFGGIVPGQSLSGDQVDIRANSGEAVLTPAQQRNFMLMANGGGGGGRNVNVGDTNIVINGNADSSTVDAIGQTLAEHRQGILELLYDADRRGEIDYSRLAIAR